MPIFRSPRVARPLLDRHLDQLPHALLVDRLERIGLEDVVLEVVGQEAADVVAAEAEASSASGRWCRRRRTAAVLAMRSASRHARGISIIVP